jgi:DNA modification methylase
MSTTRILVGDVRTRLTSVPSGSIHCVVTSPPYFGLRDYGHAGQIGLEATPDAYVAELVAVFAEVRRVLRADGTFWLNLGDSYATGSKWGGSTGGKHAKGLHGVTGVGRGKTNPGLADKQRLMIPARVALALQADGWWLRDEIIWAKPNPMPVSVTDRTTPAHEMLYMFAKSSRYYYDMEAIKEPATHKPGGGHEDVKQGGFNDKGVIPTPNGAGQRSFRAIRALRQPRSVWTITPKSFSGAHFATFPPDLVRPCVLAGCPMGGTVLDPFGGAGTTALVANSLQRNALIVELNPAYATLAAARIRHNTSLRMSLGRVAA